MFKLFEHPKFMIIYKIENSCNFYSFSNCSISKICYCLKLNNFRNWMFFYNWKIWEFFYILENANFSNLPHCKFLEFLKLKVFRLFQTWSFSKFPNQIFFEFAKFKIFGISQIESFEMMSYFFYEFVFSSFWMKL